MGNSKTDDCIGESGTQGMAYLSHVFTNLLEAVTVLDRNYKITYWNLMAEKVFGWRADEAVGSNALALTKTAFAELSLKAAEARMLKDNALEGKAICYRKDGNKVYAIIHARVVRSPDGDVEEIIVSVWDSTERKRSRDDLMKSMREFKQKNDEFRALINSMSEELYEIDKDGNIRSISKYINHINQSNDFLNINSFKQYKFFDMHGYPVKTQDMPYYCLLRGEEVINRVIRTDMYGEDKVFTINGRPIFDDRGNFIKALYLSHDITQFVKYSEQLEFHDKLLSVVNEAIIAVDENNIITYWNDAAQKLYGWTAQEAVGQRSRILLQDKEPDQSHYKVMGQLIEDGCWHGEIVYYHKDGNPILVEAFANALKDSHGNYKGLITSTRDITNRKKAMEAMRRNEEIMEFIIMLGDSLKSLDDPVEIQNTAARILGEYLKADRAMYCEVVTIDGEEFYSIERIYHVEESPMEPGLLPIYEFCKKINADGSGQTHVVFDVEAEPLVSESEYPLYSSLNLRAWIQVPLIKSSKYDACFVVQQSKPRRWTPQEVYLVEETAGRTWAAMERARAQKALRDSRKQLMTINEVYEKYVQCQTAEQLGVACLEIIEGITGSGISFVGELGEKVLMHDIAMSQNGRLQCKVEGIASHGRTWDLPHDGILGSILKGGKTLIVNNPDEYSVRIGVPEGHPEIHSFLGVPYIREGKVAGMIAVANREGSYTVNEKEILEALTPTIFEVLLRKRTEEELEKSERHAHELVNELEKADRNKNDFLSALSHELRNPLAVVSAGLQLLGMTDDPNKTGKIKEIMYHQMNQICSLVDDLLDLTRIAHNKIVLQKQEIELNKLALLAAEDIMPLFDEKGVKLKTRIMKDVLYLDADPVRLRQIMGNLLNNALKFTNPGGQVILSIHRDACKAIISVKDNGIGIKPEVLPNLFNPFIQADNPTDKPKAGLGLGLSIVKGIAELHGGSAYAESEGLNKGSCFYINLPALTSDPAAIAKQSADEKCGSKFTILVIDDNQDFTEMLGSMLALMGHNVIAANDGIDGLNKVKRLKPDVVFCDIGLSGMNGYQLAKAIRRESGLDATYLVALSGYARNEDAQKAVEEGFDRHISKPVNVPCLQTVLEETGVRLERRAAAK